MKTAGEEFAGSVKLQRQFGGAGSLFHGHEESEALELISPESRAFGDFAHRDGKGYRWTEDVHFPLAGALNQDQVVGMEDRLRDGVGDLAADAYVVIVKGEEEADGA